MSRRPGHFGFVCLALFVGSACTNDYDKFHATGSGGVDGGDASGAVGGGGSSASGGSAGSGGSTGGTSGGGTGGGTGGTGATGGDGSGGTTGGTGGDGGGVNLGGAAGACPTQMAACAGICTEISSDLANCGECNRACSSTGVEVAVCSAGLCTSSCALGRANCAQPATGADDGCERDVAGNAASCGSCNNNCQSQGASGGFSCTNSGCSCTTDLQCLLSGGGNGTCDTTTGICTCETTVCARGEACTRSGSRQVCRCNGGAACASGQTCCQTPAGCFDLATDATNCGACGRACAPGQTCNNGACS